MHTCHSPLGRGRSVEHDRVPSLVGLPWTEKLEDGSGREAAGLTPWEVESQWLIPGSRAVRGGAAGGGESQGRSQVSPGNGRKNRQGVGKNQQQNRHTQLTSCSRLFTQVAGSGQSGPEPAVKVSTRTTPVQLADSPISIRPCYKI